MLFVVVSLVVLAVMLFAAAGGLFLAPPDAPGPRHRASRVSWPTGQGHPEESRGVVVVHRMSPEEHGPASHGAVSTPSHSEEGSGPGVGEPR